MHTIRDVLTDASLVGTRASVRGWVKTRRDSKQGLSFVQLDDGSCFADLQIVTDGELPNYATEVAKLTTGCSIEASGEVVESKGKGQSVEIKADAIHVVGWVDNPDTYPVSPKRHTFEYLREQAHLRPRTNTFGAVTRVRHRVAQSIHGFLDGEGFYWVNTPLITASDCEGGGELFRVSTLDLANLPRDAGGAPDFDQDFFGREAFLTVSGQLNVECYARALSKVYTFGPTFRAENSNTSRHLAEFWMIEPEVAFADLDDNAALAEAFIKAIIRNALEARADDMAFFDQRIEKGLVDRLTAVLNASFERMTYTEAVDILKRSGKSFEYPVEWGADLQSEHERYLTEEHVKAPLVVTDYPKDIKAFYMRLNDDGKTVAAMDVLVPGVGEIIGGSQREERLDVLDARMAEMGLGQELWWYRDLRRYGTVPNAGFGLGFERMISYLTGMTNVRDVIPFPRTPRNAAF